MEDSSPHPMPVPPDSTSVSEKEIPTVWKYLICGLISVQAHANTRHHLPSSSKSDTVLSTISTATVIPSIQQQPNQDRRQTLCLALAIYREARGEQLFGQHAIGDVIFNRINETGGSICQTVWQNGQFPWTHWPVRSIMPHELPAWRNVQETAVGLLTRQTRYDVTDGATMFYNPRLCRPHWHGEVTARIGEHVFMRPGPAPVGGAGP
jgi:spore germination cell wall hydrolase CwlJ-like protein